MMISWLSSTDDVYLEILLDCSLLSISFYIWLVYDAYEWLSHCFSWVSIWSHRYSDCSHACHRRSWGQRVSQSSCNIYIVIERICILFPDGTKDRLDFWNHLLSSFCMSSLNWGLSKKSFSFLAHRNLNSWSAFEM